MLVVFCENLPKIILSFVVGKSKFVFFVGQNLNSRITFILERRQIAVCALHGCCPAAPDPQPRTRDQFVRTDTVHVGWMHAGDDHGGLIRRTGGTRHLKDPEVAVHGRPCF